MDDMTRLAVVVFPLLSECLHGVILIFWVPNTARYLKGENGKQLTEQTKLDGNACKDERVRACS